MKTYSTSPLERVAYFGYNDGSPADVYLRDNIEEIDVPAEGDDTDANLKQWIADEVHVKTYLPKDEIEENFDALWVQAETNLKPLEQRVAEAEATLDEIITVILGGEE